MVRDRHGDAAPAFPIWRLGLVRIDRSGVTWTYPPKPRSTSPARYRPSDRLDRPPGRASATQAAISPCSSSVEEPSFTFLTMHLQRCIVGNVDAIDLITLGRQLIKVGEQAMRGGAALPLPAGHAVVLRDVLGHPGSSITDITTRTGLAQSVVSKAVAKFQADEMIESEVDPADRRRILVRVSSKHLREVGRKGSVPADQALAGALGESDPDAVAEVVGSLQALAERLRPNTPGAVLSQLHGERSYASRRRR